MHTGATESHMVHQWDRPLTRANWRQHDFDRDQAEYIRRVE